MKNIFIIGSRGYHTNYGGWETFVSNLVDHYNDKNTKFYITMDTDDKNLKINNLNANLTIIPIYVKTKGSIKMLIHSIKALNYSLKYIENNNIDNAYIYILGLKLFNYLKIKKKKIQSLKIKTYVNPDGLEWKRGKWSYPIKKFFLLSEKFMLKDCDYIICDSLGIEKYIWEKYPDLKNKTTYIAYGAEEIDLKNTNEDQILKEYSLTKNEYCLMVGRCVPENNYELVIKDFMNSKIKKDLVIITNLNSSNYYNYLINTTNCLQDKRIKFINGVYEKEKLAVIRKNAYLYIHGHSVGGTNPSLIEALSITDLNILYDVCFNHDIGLDTCLYFKESGSLTKLLDNSKLLEDSKEKLKSKVKKRFQENFTWKIIIDKYKEIFK